MKSLREQFKEAGDYVALSKTEKNRMREEIVSYMEYKPIRKNTTEEKKKTHTSFFPFFNVHHFTGALLIALFMTTSTFGVTLAADSALPGDLLYGVKVNINEEIKSVLRFSPASRIAWKKERVERRLMEASHLAAQGRLDEESAEKLSRLFVEQSGEMIEEVRAIVGAGNSLLAAEASGEFEESLDTHEAVLARLIVDEEDESDEDSRGFVKQVRTTSMEVEKIREDVENKIVTDDEEQSTDEPEEEDETSTDEKVKSANMRIRSVQRAQEQAEELHSEVLEHVSQLEAETTLREQATRQVAFGESKMDAGAEAFLAYEYSDAYKGYRQAVASFQKVIQLLEIANLFSVEIYSDSSENEEVTEESDEESVTVEEKDEELAEIETLHASVKQAIKDARSLLLTQDGHDIKVVDEAHKRVKDASAYMLRGEIALVLEDYDDARELFEDANLFAQRTLEALEKESKRDSVEDLAPIPAQPPEEAVQEPDIEPITVAHNFSEGEHSYTLRIDTPTPCHSLSHTVAVAESLPEKITISIETVPPQEEGQMCAQVIDTKEYTITVTASSEATLTSHLLVDGVEVEWITPETEGESIEENIEETEEGSSTPEDVSQEG